MVKNLAQAFFENAASRPDALALRIDGKDHSYAELAERASRFARFATATCAADASVGIYAARSLDAYAAVMGVLAAGRSYVPLSVEAPAARLRDVLVRSKVQLVISDRPVDSSLDDLSLRFVDASDLPAAREGDGLFTPTEVDVDTLAYVIFTSGTTGQPKGVKIGVGNVQSFLRAAAQRSRISARDRVSQFYELNFDPSVFDLLLTLSAGASLHVVPSAQRLAPAKFIQDERLTIWSSVPSVLAFMDRMKLLTPDAFPCLRYAMFCGDALPETSARALARAAPQCTIDCQYGPTETTVTCSGGVVAHANELRWTARVTKERGIISIGKPFPGTRMGIVSDGMFLPAGSQGEIVVAGCQVALGYLDDEVLTARKFVMLDHPEHGRELWYLSGDLGYADADGHYHCLGRVDHQVKVLGHRIELEEIDAHLFAVTGRAGATIAWPIEQGVPTGLVAFVTSELSASEVLLALKQRLPPYMVPKRVMKLEQLPLGPNGKLDRKALALELAPKRDQLAG